MIIESNVQNLNRALKELAVEDDKIVFIGEDIKEPYGGSFKVEEDMSILFPDRVISTPISEESFTGMAAGMAVKGYKPIVDLMFSDFMTLTFDILVNFASKYITMYGSNKELSMIVRCANGGYRGYGPTHSQSMQKYFMGVPNLCVYEMSAFHDNKKVFKRMLDEKKPCLFFEEKIDYINKVYCEGKINDLLSYKYCGNNYNWAVAYTENECADVAIICHGGISKICIEAAEKLFLEEEIEVKIFIPSKLYPCSINEIYEKLVEIGNVIVVEESTDGADWGSVILKEINKLGIDGKKIRDIRIVTSKEAVIPANYQLEQRVLISEVDVINEIRSMLR